MDPRAYLRHAVTHRKSCSCDIKGEPPRDPTCGQLWPLMCPYRAMQIYRFHTGDKASPLWWLYQLGHREDDGGDEPFNPRQFDRIDLTPLYSVRRQ